jgi:hypothetical protein
MKRRILVALDEAEYRRLEELAAAEELATDQQARWLLKRALRAEPPERPERREVRR